MLSDDPTKMHDEIRAAIRLRRMHTNKSKEMIEMYAGSAYRDGWHCREGDMNHPFELITNQLPSLAYNNPAARIKSRRPRVQRELVKAMQHGLNRNISDIDLVTKLQRVALDSFFDFGVLLTTLEPLPGYEGKRQPPMRPGVRRISPRLFFQDPLGGINGPRYIGHIVVKDKEDIKNARGVDGKPLYDQKLVEELATDAYNDDDREIHQLQKELSLHRDQVMLYEVWVPERGMIYTITEQGLKSRDAKPAFLREPRKAFCPPWGPYTVFGMYDVPDELYALSPLTATSSQVNELNDHRAQLRRQADLAKKLILVDGKNETLVNSIVTYADGTIVAMKNFDPNGFAEVELTGPSPHMTAYVEQMKGELDQTSGLTQSRRGQVTGATATEIAEASQGQDARMRYMQQRFRRATIQVLKSLAWYMYHAESVVYPVPQQRADEMLGQFQQEEENEKDGLFLGGVQPGQEDFSFDDLELEIEPYSMEIVDQATLQRTMQQVFATLTAALPLMLQFPFANWPQILDDYFESVNIPDGRKYIDWPKLEEMIQAQFAPGPLQEIPGLDGAPAPDLAGLRSRLGQQQGQMGGATGEDPRTIGGGGRVIDIAAMLRQPAGGAAA